MRPRYSDIADRLRFVTTALADYDLANFPDFLFIGPQRTGTTWLHYNLRCHPHVFVPWQKELYYWNNLEHPHLHPASLPPVEQELQWYLDRMEITAAEASSKTKECRQVYDTAFAPRVRGEGSATYAASLHQGIIAEMALLNPELKVVVFVRDPIERAWSHAKKDLARAAKRSAQDVSDEEWLRYLQIPYVLNCGRYSEWLPRWRAVFGDNILVRPFTSIAERPDELLAEVLEHIGVEADPAFIGARTKSLVMRTEAAPMPTRVRRHLDATYANECVVLRDLGLI